MWKYVEIIGLKAPGNYSDQLWFNEILVLLCEGPKRNISMISGFGIPGAAYLWILKYPITSQLLQSTRTHFQKYYLWTSTFLSIREKMGTEQ